MSLRAPALLALATVAAAAAGCGSMSPDTKETIENVLTLQQGTVTNVRELRGRGPFREYAVPPAEMLDLATRVLKARVPAVFPNPRALEVVAKERIGKDAAVDDYQPAWVSAVVVIVHPVAEDPGRSRVEVHATQRGPFNRGHIAWEHDVPAALDAMVAARGRPAPAPVTPPRIKPIP